jgi:hypothetical protein
MKGPDIKDLVAELRDLKICVAQLERQRQPDSPKEDRLQIGDRVQIKNKIRKPSTWPRERPRTEAQERLAVIRQVTRDRIYITTDKGTLTWQHPSNLKKEETTRHHD